MPLVRKLGRNQEHTLRARRNKRIDIILREVTCIESRIRNGSKVQERR
jgi:hypothetical protein